MWKKVKLKDVCKIVNGGTPKSNVKEYWEGEIRWLTPKDMGKLNSKYVDATERQITVEGLDNSSAKLVPENSLILSCRAPIGHVFINSIEMSFNQGCKALIPSAELDINYLYYFVYSSKQLLNDLGTGTTFKEISSKTLGNVEIPLPPLAEQKRIVAKLDATFTEIDKSIDIKNRKLENTNQLAERVLTTVFNSNLDCSDSTLGDYYDVRDGTHDSPKYVDEGFPLVTSKNLKSGKLDLENVKFISERDYVAINKRSSVKVGDVLMAMIGTIGNPIVITETPCYSIKNVALFKTDSSQNPFYLKYFLELPSTKNKMLKDAKGTTQKFVGLGYLRKFQICVPNIDVQNRVVEQIDNSLSKISEVEDKLKKSIDELGALKASILTQELNPSEAA